MVTERDFLENGYKRATGTNRNLHHYKFVGLKVKST